MAKRSQRFPVNYEKDQSGCMWGFISIFDFRHACFTRKLIVDRTHGNKHVVGAALIKNKFEVLSNLDKNMKAILLNGKDLPEDGQFLSSRELMKALQGQHQRGTTNNIAMSGMSAFKTIGLASVTRSCSRNNDVVEPMIKPQWYVNCNDLAKQNLVIDR
ncbi:Valine--tRNA ligase, mitochondrial 1 [Glycine max]|nr:Valine--tRNA ligase, mitochondrial 1 [Glycine max]